LRWLWRACARSRRARRAASGRGELRSSHGTNRAPKARKRPSSRSRRGDRTRLRLAPIVRSCRAHGARKGASGQGEAEGDPQTLSSQAPARPTFRTIPERVRPLRQPAGSQNTRSRTRPFHASLTVPSYLLLAGTGETSVRILIV